jgi:hypothetical protein
LTLVCFFAPALPVILLSFSVDLRLGADWDPVVEVGDIAEGVTRRVTRQTKKRHAVAEKRHVTGQKRHAGVFAMSQNQKESA